MIGILFGSIIALCCIIILYGNWAARKLPENTPKTYLKSNEKSAKKRVVCIGDSITHGRVSHSYVDELSERFRPDNYTLINAGINTELAYNVLMRLDEIIQTDPDYITLLIGTNDALASLSPKKAASYIKEMKLPQQPDSEWFEKNLTLIVDRLQKETKARIALLTIPPITEDRQDPAYLRAQQYSNIISQIAFQHKVPLIPLNETIDRLLAKQTNKSRSQFSVDNEMKMYLAIFYHFILGKNWDKIAKMHDLVYLTDNIHLSKKGAMLVADFAEDFVRADAQ